MHGSLPCHVLGGRGIELCMLCRSCFLPMLPLSGGDVMAAATLFINILAQY